MFYLTEQSLIMEYYHRVCGAQNTASLEIFTQLMAGFGFPPEQAPDFFRWVLQTTHFPGLISKNVSSLICDHFDGIT